MWSQSVEVWENKRGENKDTAQSNNIPECDLDGVGHFMLSGRTNAGIGLGDDHSAKAACLGRQHSQLIRVRDESDRSRDTADGEREGLGGAGTLWEERTCEYGSVEGCMDRDMEGGVPTKGWAFSASRGSTECD